MSLQSPGYGELAIDLLEEEPRQIAEDDPDWLATLPLHLTQPE